MGEVPLYINRANDLKTKVPPTSESNSFITAKKTDPITRLGKDAIESLVSNPIFAVGGFPSARKVQVGGFTVAR